MDGSIFMFSPTHPPTQKKKSWPQNLGFKVIHTKKDQVPKITLTQIQLLMVMTQGKPQHDLEKYWDSLPCSCVSAGKAWFIHLITMPNVKKSSPDFTCWHTQIVGIPYKHLRMYGHNPVSCKSSKPWCKNTIFLPSWIASHSNIDPHIMHNSKS